MLVVTSDFIM